MTTLGTRTAVAAKKKPPSLKTLLAAIQETDEILARDLSRLPSGPLDQPGKHAAMPGHVMRRRQAEDDRRVLVDQYAQTILRGVGAIYLDGLTQSQQADFQTVAEDEAVIVDFDELLFGRLYKQLEPTFAARRGRRLDPTFFSNLSLAVDNLCDSYHVRHPRLKFVGEVAKPTDADILAYIRKTLTPEIASTLIVAIATKKIVDDAIARGYTKSTMPVLVLGARQGDEGTLRGIFGARSVRLAWPSDAIASDDLIADAFKSLKATFK